jgi:hypothetical protein
MPALLPAVAVETLFTTAAVAPTLAAAAPVVAPVVAAEVAAPLVAAEVAAPAAANALGILPQVTTGLAPEVVGGAQGIMSGGAATVPTAAGSTAATTAGAGNAELLKGLDAAKFDAVSMQTGLPANAYPAVPPGSASAPPITSPGPAGNTINTAFGNVAAPTTPPPPGGSPFTLPQSAGITEAAAPTSKLVEGGQSAFKMLGEAYDSFNKLPMAAKLGTALVTSELAKPSQSGPKKEEYKSSFNSGSFNRSEANPYIYGGPGGGTGVAADNEESGFNRSEPNPYLYGGGFANGGLMGYDVGGPVEQMSNTNAGIMPTTGQNNMYPMSQQRPFAYANPSMQNPISQNVLDVGDAGNLDSYTGMPKFAEGGSTTYDDDKEAAKVAAMRKRYSQMMGNNSNMEENVAEMKSAAARAQSKAGHVGHGIDNLREAAGPAAVNDLEKLMKKFKIASSMPKVLSPDSGSMEYAASGGIMHGLGGYSDYASGGRLLKGPGDGVSDSIPAVIGSKQPARLADGEFVIPARIVSELGNGSTEAGARQLYAMMERIQKGRKKSVGKGKVAVNSKAAKHLPA